MLLLVFRLGGDRYALEASQVQEVLPLVELRPVPKAPVGVAGIFEFRGVPVPVIDMSMLVIGRPAERRMSTRLIVVGYPDSTGAVRSLGLIAEQATRTIERSLDDFADTGLSDDRAWYLGPVASDAEGLLQWVDVSQLLPASVRDVLFRPREKGPWSSGDSRAC